MSEWIYESQDGGKTITRRLPHEAYARELKVDINGETGWFVLKHLNKIAQRAIDEQNYRKQYPELEELWQQYHTLLALLKNGPQDDYL